MDFEDFVIVRIGNPLDPEVVAVDVRLDLFVFAETRLRRFGTPLVAKTGHLASGVDADQWRKDNEVLGVDQVAAIDLDRRVTDTARKRLICTVDEAKGCAGNPRTIGVTGVQGPTDDGDGLVDRCRGWPVVVHDVRDPPNMWIARIATARRTVASPVLSLAAVELTPVLVASLPRVVSDSLHWWIFRCLDESLR